MPPLPPTLAIVYLSPDRDREFVLCAVFCRDVRAADDYREQLAQADARGTRTVLVFERIAPLSAVKEILTWEEAENGAVMT